MWSHLCAMGCAWYIQYLLLWSSGTRDKLMIFVFPIHLSVANAGEANPLEIVEDCILHQQMAHIRLLFHSAKETLPLTGKNSNGIIHHAHACPLRCSSWPPSSHCSGPFLPEGFRRHVFRGKLWQKIIIGKINGLVIHMLFQVWVTKRCLFNWCPSPPMLIHMKLYSHPLGPSGQQPFIMV